MRPPTIVLLAAMLGVILAACDARREPLSTAPTMTKADASQVPRGPVVPEITSPEAATSEPTFADAASAQEVNASAVLGDPLQGLDATQLQRFLDGKEEFEEVETAATGLGPVFNDESCVSCHDAPVGGTNNALELHVGRWEGGRFDPLERFGGPIIQREGIGRVDTEHGSFTFVPEAIPREANVSAQRMATPLFGAGLVEAVPDRTLIALSVLQAIYSPATRGMPNIVRDASSGASRVGRFGWKSQVATLKHFAGDAYLNEMGITSPTFPMESRPQGNPEPLMFNPAPGLNDDGGDVQSFADFMTLLGPPPRGRSTYQTVLGEAVFYAIGCANCHTPTLVTGDSPIPALSRKRFHPYSDFLVHDMGSLGDGIVQGRSGPRQMRTSPLWGMGSRTLFLHDGRAKTIEEAILAHDGQGAYSRDRWARLGSLYRGLVLRFLKSL